MTKTYGLLGKNIDYSFSRSYFSEKFSKENIKAEYKNFDLPDIGHFEAILKKEEKLSGLNVTIPYKLQIIPFLDQLSDDAQAIGAVNTIKFEKNGKLTGHNTDFYGFSEALKPKLKPAHKKALLLGTGGASLAVAHALKLMNIGFTWVSRSPQQNQLAYKQLTPEIIKNHLLIINCTPLGTAPNTENAPNIPYEYLGSTHYLFDLIYNPAETTFLNYGRKKGAQTSNGLKMLKLQAEKAWEIWHS